jgi:mannose-1-phosphate guanylyltransferase / mannose-6-phosphate isomerase
LPAIADRALFAAAVVVASVAHRNLLSWHWRRPGRRAPPPAGADAARYGRGDAAAAAYFAKRRDPDATLLVLAADHVIRDTPASPPPCVRPPAAEAGKIVVFGIVPDYPGHRLRLHPPGEPLPGGEARAVAAFVEKPDAARAGELIAEGCLWNSGMFLLRAAVALAEAERHAPDIAAAAPPRSPAADIGRRRDGPRRRSLRRRSARLGRLRRDGKDRRAWRWWRHVSTGRDVGAWSAVWEAADKDAAGNVVLGDAVLLDTKGAYVSTDAQRIGVVGLDDVVVVAADGAVLVTTRARAGDVKELVGAIEARRRRCSAISSATIVRGATTSRSIRDRIIRSSVSLSTRAAPVAAEARPPRRALDGGRRRRRNHRRHGSRQPQDVDGPCVPASTCTSRRAPSIAWPIPARRR